MIGENDIFEYEYMDTTIADNRERVLKDFIVEKRISDDFSFYDLDFYLKPVKKYQKIRKIIYQSKYEPSICLLDAQIEILNILEKHNLFLSAPTSFGKTFMVLEYMTRHPEIKNVVFIVPTLALMNELLKKIYVHFSNEYNICINGDERIDNKNIFIFVPERSDYKFIDRISNIGLDLLIIDEIYKLKVSKKDLKSDDRFITMNRVYLNLIRRANKIVLLGPFIRNISFDNSQIDIVKYYTNLLPVYNCVHKCVDEKWIDYMGDSKELVFFSSPGSIYSKIDDIIQKFDEDPYYVDKYKNEIKHLEDNIYKDWYAVKLLKRGIGIHHGKTPMFLRKFYEDEFKNGDLKGLLCTQTLMEGINTPTMRLLVVDDPGDIFSLNNLIGRVGRLNVKNPKSGDVYIFNDNTWNYYEDRNKWEELIILAEDKNIYVDDEILFLDKKCDDQTRLNAYNEKINLILSASNKSQEDLKKYDIKIDKAYKFVKEKYESKFLNCASIKDCIITTCSLLKKVGYIFEKKDFDNLKYENENLPSNSFIQSFLSGKSINEIVVDFEQMYGKLSIKNTNLLIDKLLELRIIIKFKLCKISNYLELFNVNIRQNRYLKMFVSMISSFSDLNINDKILEDLGIEEKDHLTLSKFLAQDGKISASDVIKTLKNNRNQISRMSLSPFTKRCIDKF